MFLRRIWNLFYNKGGLLKGPTSAYLKFTGEMLEAFMILTDSMYKKGEEQLLSHGKFNQTYSEGADELKETPDFEATEYNCILAEQVKKDLTDVAQPNTPENIAPYMENMVDICSRYLAQNAEFNKDKGPAFKALVKQMKTKPKESLYQKGKAKRTYATAATELEKAKGLESDYDDPNLSQEIHQKLTALMAGVTPPELKTDMAETVDICSKYLSQCAVNENERGPAFDILIKTLEKNGSQAFTPEHPPLANKYATAYTLKSAPGLTSITPDPSTAPKFVTALHMVVDGQTPANLKSDMDEVLDRCGNYLSAFVRDRDKAVEVVVKALKSNDSKELSKRNNYAMKYGTAAIETETAPMLVPFLPVKDIADENKAKITKDVESITPRELKVAVKSAVTDVSKHLSQPVAMRSGAAGVRYPMELMGKMMQSLGNKPLFKYKSYGQTYSDGAEVLKYSGPMESSPKAENLKVGIKKELNRGVPTRTAPTIVDSMSETIEDASKHLAKVGQEKGEAVDHLVKQMKVEGDTPLGKLQGYDQTYGDGARRIEIADSLTNDKVDKAAYEGVRGKLTALSAQKPNPEHEKIMPTVVDEASKYLAAPFPETGSEKRRVLGDLMSRKGDEVLAREEKYEMSYTEGGKELMKAPDGVHTAYDATKKKNMDANINNVIPDDKLKNTLRVPASEGAAHLTDTIKGRGEALAAIQKGLKKEGAKELINVGKFNKTHEGGAEMLDKAHFGGENPNPILLDTITKKVDKLDKSGVSALAKQHMGEAVALASNHIADVATKECGLDANGIAAWEASNAAAREQTEKAAESPRTIEPVVQKSDEDKSKVNDEEERRRAEEEKRRAEEEKRRAEEERRRAEEERRRAEEERLKREGRRSIDTGRPAVVQVHEPSDVEHEQALGILHKQLLAKGDETFYKQPRTNLTHRQASQWLGIQPPMHVDKTVKESGDTARLHQKFERKLSALVATSTPITMKDNMQDVVIESSRILSEYFVSANYKALVKDALISEMQKQGNEIIAETNTAAETAFFAAQRLKKTKSLEVNEPSKVSYGLMKKLEEIIRLRSMARKLTATMKDHVKEAADYLSGVVTKPDEQIEAYVAMLTEMEAQGSALLIEGNIPKSYRDCASYLRSLTSYEDQINLPNSSLQSSTENKLLAMMSKVAERGYTQSILKSVISDSSRLLVSYIVLQGERTEALKVVIEQMDNAADGLLLRHGAIRKTNADGAELLRGKNTDQLAVSSADPVVARKVQIKLNNLMEFCIPDKYKNIMDDVISDATLYLAVHLLQPLMIKVCKCMKSVFVQCELWCDEILRRVARPCCTCSRHVSAQALEDLAPAERVRVEPGAAHASAPGVDISIRPCAARSRTCNRRDPNTACPAPKPSPGCDPTTYMLYSTQYTRQRQYVIGPTRLPRSPSDSIRPSSNAYSSLHTSLSLSPLRPPVRSVDYCQPGPSRSDETHEVSSESSPTSFYTPDSRHESDESCESKPLSWARPAPPTMHSNIWSDDTRARSGLKMDGENPISVKPVKGRYSARSAIVSTDQMADWHSMMVSLTWNVQAWRNWIQETIDQALMHHQSVRLQGEAEESWSTFRRRIVTEALQWRQYNLFSRQLTLRLALRYRDKQIVSPTRATVKTPVYMECQKEMLEIINMFNRWTHWLSIVVKETDSLQTSSKLDTSNNDMRWNYFKSKVEEYAEDWHKYNMHLKVCWEHQYMKLIKDWLPMWNQAGPVWVMSASGAVPSGAVAAGTADGEVIWVARTTHRCRVLPAALRPSKHCCLLYADGAVHYYTKYQVMCNADATWVAWRAGELGARAVRVAAGVHVGRVLYRGAHLLGAVHAPNYRCHVVIFGRPFAFNCYELLVLNDGAL